MTSLEVATVSARVALAARAREHERGDRLFDDPVASARCLAKDRASLARLGGDSLANAIAVRTRVFDDWIQPWLVPDLLIVNLGSGADTRRHRLGVWDCEWIDVDVRNPEEFEASRHVRGEVASQETWRKLKRILARYAHDRPLLWIAEGLFGYVDEDVRQRVLDVMVRSTSGPTVIVFDVPNADARAHAALPMCGHVDRPEAVTLPGFETEFRSIGSDGANFGRWSVSNTEEGAKTFLFRLCRRQSIDPAPRLTPNPLSRFYEAEIAAERLHEPKRHLDITLLRKLADRSHGPVLDLGCGYGRHALPLAMHHEVTGVDEDSFLLRSMRRRRRTMGVERRLTVIGGDLRALHPKNDFGLVCLMHDVLSLCSSKRTRPAFLRRLRSHLRPGGYLVLDVTNPHGSELVLGRERSSTGLAERETPYEKQYRVDPSPDDTYWVSGEYTVKGDSNAYRFRYSVYLQDVASLTADLRCAGFELERILSSVSSEFTPGDGRILLVLTRAKL